AAQSSRGDTATVRPRIERVVFRGVEALDERLLRQSIATRATRCRTPLMAPFCWFSSAPLWKERHYLDPLEVERDELRLRVVYFARGWRQTQVAAEVVPRGDDVVDVVFTIDEGEPTRIAALRVAQVGDVLGEGTIRRARLP